jgi:MEMO1 family protein
MIRNPAVAGQFYQGTEKLLQKEVEALINISLPKFNAIGVVSPHAGYMYSGKVAGAVLSSISPKPTYIVMGPNHTGLGQEFSISTQASWKTPLGEVKIDRELADAIKNNSQLIKEDSMAHAYEHSVEVQLPFLQVLQKDLKLVPMVISYSDIGSYREVGRAIAAAIKSTKKTDSVTIIASSDMTHYEPHDSAKEKDQKAIKAILELDEKKLIDTISKFSISMCGWAPASIMLAAAKELGAKSARLIKYETSGDASGDYSSVVGYAGIIVT